MSQIFVYLDTLYSGLVPAVVDAVWIKPDGGISLDVTVTANRRNYSRGEKVTDNSPTFVVPRFAVFRPRGTYFPRIAAYSWRHLLNITDGDTAGRSETRAALSE